MYLKTTIQAVIVVILLTSVLPCRAQDDSPLKFRETEWNFGEIMEDGGVVSHKFIFRNSGAVPVAIDRANASCGCTTPSYTRSLVQPGGEGSVTVSFDPMGYPGIVSKSVVVVSGGGKYYDLLVIGGKVIPRRKTVEEEYPHELAGGLRVDNTVLAFGQVAQGGASSMVVRYINTSDKAVKLEAVQEDGNGLLEIHAPQTVCAGCRGEITFTYDLTENQGRYGMTEDTVRLIVDGHPSQKMIYAIMTGVDDFASRDTDTAPRMTLNGQFHNFGEIRRRTMPYTYRITLTNDGKEQLNIRSVSEKSGMRATLRAGMTIAAGESLPFDVLLYSDKYRSGELLENIVVVTDDPVRPVREIRVSAKIK